MLKTLQILMYKNYRFIILLCWQLFPAIYLSEYEAADAFKQLFLILLSVALCAARFPFHCHTTALVCTLTDLLTYKWYYVCNRSKTIYPFVRYSKKRATRTAPLVSIMHQIVCRLALHPRPHRERKLHAPSDPLVQGDPGKEIRMREGT